MSLKFKLFEAELENKLKSLQKYNNDKKKKWGFSELKIKEIFL